jgi:hypothetical protein
VELNQYVFYDIILDNATDVISVQIRVEDISGILTFLTSQMFTEPTFDKIYEKDSDIKYVWNGTVNYYTNLS